MTFDHRNGRMRKWARAIREGLFSLRGVQIGERHFRLPFGPVQTVQEPWMRDVLQLALRHFDGDFVDVGANLGQTLLHFRSVDSRRRYVGFEPNPHCASYLMQLISLNTMPDTIVFPVACGKQYAIEVLDFYQNSPFDASASIVRDFRPSLATVASRFVVAAPVDACLLAAGVNRLGIVKIDVEGYEANVIEALEERLASDRPCLIVEILPVYNEDNAVRLNDNLRIEALVARAGYSILRVRKSQTGRFDRLTRVDSIGVHGDMNLVDYVLCPAEQVDRLLADPRVSCPDAETS